LVQKLLIKSGAVYGKRIDQIRALADPNAIQARALHAGHGAPIALALQKPWYLVVGV
jgi:hypothetical protein